MRGGTCSKWSPRVAAVAASGCGGDEERLSKADYQAEILAVIGEATALRPPEQVQGIHDDFVAAARKSVDRIGEARKDGMPSTKEAERAIARLNRQGYLVFGE